MTRILEFPDLPGVSTDLRYDLVKRATLRHVTQGSVVFAPGAQVDALLIILSGTLRVEQLAETGREIVLYRVHGAERCIFTGACLLSDATQAATGIAETDLDLLSVIKVAFDDLMVHSHAFRGLIFEAYSKRITDLMQVVEEVAFRRIDIRLAGRLIDLSGPAARIVATQRQMATELGTAREVVSRQLGEFQRRGWVEVGNGHVRLLDKEALRTLAHSDRTSLV